MRIVDAVRGVECKPAMAFQNLALAPLVADRDREAGYVVLDDALARGWVTVTELSEGGHVPELKVVNRGAEPHHSRTAPAHDHHPGVLCRVGPVATCLAPVRLGSPHAVCRGASGEDAPGHEFPGGAWYPEV